MDEENRFAIGLFLVLLVPLIFVATYVLGIPLEDKPWNLNTFGLVVISLAILVLLIAAIFSKHLVILSIACFGVAGLGLTIAVGAGVISLYTFLIGLIIVFVFIGIPAALLAGGSGGGGGGEADRENYEYPSEDKERRPFFIDKEAYQKGYNDAARYWWREEPPEIENVLDKSEERAYKLGWEDRKKDRPPEEL
jgi:hypothetical protein